MIFGTREWTIGASFSIVVAALSVRSLDCNPICQIHTTVCSPEWSPWNEFHGTVVILLDLRLEHLELRLRHQPDGQLWFASHQIRNDVINIKSLLIQ